MSSLQRIPIIGFPGGGLQTNVKPFLLPEVAMQTLENAYCWRGRYKKRLGNQLVGRLQRQLTGQSLGMTTNGVTSITFNDIFTTIGTFAGENPEINPATLIITIGAPDTSTFTDNGMGGFSVTGLGVQLGSYIDYVSGKLVLQFSSPLTGGASITASFGYFPTLPVMGIIQRELSGVNDDQTIFFDTKYAYDWSGTQFVEFIPGTTWSGTNHDFFWGTNYRGSAAQTRLFFVTNFVNDASDPMRYTDGSTWTTFAPAVDSINFLFQARILIPYFGRLLALNTQEGTSIGTSVNIFNRCRFSQIGDPTSATAWRSDQFGRGGFIDAPTNEEIVSVAFIRNTLIVLFENSTWQIRYVGEYGLPFIWERISSDLGGDSTFSPVLFNDGILAVGDKAVISADPVKVDRIDLAIPDQIFDFQTSNNGLDRIQGIRDYQRELVFWNYVESSSSGTRIFPNKVLVYNYRNNTFAQFRDNITAFGTFQSNNTITWDRTDIFWEDEDITWDDPTATAEFPFIVMGNQQGFIMKYGYTSPDEGSLSITEVDLTGTYATFTVTNHNLDPENDDIIQLVGLQFINPTTSDPVANNINNNIYQAFTLDKTTGLYNTNTFTLQSFQNGEYVDVLSSTITPQLANGVYIGGGRVVLLPKMFIQTKDFNPYQDKGLQTKMSYVDFLLENPGTQNPNSAVSIQIFLNTSPAVQTNLLLGQKEVETNTPSHFYVPASDIAWHRFIGTLAGQYFSIVLTYDDTLMNLIETHSDTFELHAITISVRPGGKIIF